LSTEGVHGQAKMIEEFSTFGIAKRSSESRAQPRVKKPSAAIRPSAIALAMYSISVPVMKGLPKGIVGCTLTSILG